MCMKNSINKYIKINTPVLNFLKSSEIKDLVKSFSFFCVLNIIARNNKLITPQRIVLKYLYTLRISWILKQIPHIYPCLKQVNSMNLFPQTFA